MRVEKLNPDNAERYLKYLRVAFAEEPEQMTAEQVDEEGILKRVSDPFLRVRNPSWHMREIKW